MGSRDLDGDGRPEVPATVFAEPNILIVDRSIPGITVLRGMGDGATFEQDDELIFDSGLADSPTAIGVTDLNGDGKSDIVVASGTASGSLVTLLCLLLLYGLREMFFGEEWPLLIEMRPVEKSSRASGNSFF